ncbi:DNA polymerase IV [Tuberibacillus sp. Marseille-P3662]|uniref:DNA polymerase IV n=1 Tax=Tuberibacillus sp. Marseille-P3662 TaxID=1965358 RepID=UPI000A1CF05B|nr:DNA polymerase IV [Tuberibacillus sp. Marseille-P3662]
MKGSVIFLVDMQSFYVSVEKADDPTLQNQPVIVSGDPERRSGIILAACPIAKEFGVETAEPLWKAQQKCPQAVVRRPRMQRYIDMSLQITKICEQFTDLVEPFSIDEQFLDVTGSQRLFGEPFEIATKIQTRIMAVTGVYARVGMGPNKVLAKMACDNFAKKNRDGIFQLDTSNMQEKLWPLPIGKLFGVGNRMEQHLIRMGIRQIGHLANFPLQQLQSRWGINGQVLWQTANGRDFAPVTTQTHDGQKAIGHNMTLPRDYEILSDIRVVLLELSQEVARRARAKGYTGQTVSLGVRGADFDRPTGFHRQIKLTSPTDFDLDIYHAADHLLHRYWDQLPIRSLGVTLSQLQQGHNIQLSLFEATNKKHQLNQALDTIYHKYGNTAIVRAASLTAAGQTFERSAKIGGHYK